MIVKAQRGWMTCLISGEWGEAEPGFEPRELGLSTCDLTTRPKRQGRRSRDRKLSGQRRRGRMVLGLGRERVMVPGIVRGQTVCERTRGERGC